MGEVVGTRTAIRLPHQVIYETSELASISDVIEALRGAEQLLLETGPLLESLIPGLEISKITVSVEEISQRSPLNEIFWASIFLTFQKDLEREVPKLVEELFGVHVSEQYDTIVTLLFCLILYYGVAFAYHQVNRLIGDSKTRSQLNALIAEVAVRCNRSEDHIRAALERRYGRGHVKSLVRAGLQFFLPSKQQANAPVRIGSRIIDAETVAEIPSAAQMLEFEPATTSRQLDNVEMQLHAQDVDRTKRGWAAVIPAISKMRIRMEIYPPIKPEDIYMRPNIRGDVVIVYKMSDRGELVPQTCHLMRIRD